MPEFTSGELGILVRMERSAWRHFRPSNADEIRSCVRAYWESSSASIPKEELHKLAERGAIGVPSPLGMGVVPFVDPVTQVAVVGGGVAAAAGYRARRRHDREHRAKRWLEDRIHARVLVEEARAAARANRWRPWRRACV
jgi:hypothetical protein